MPTDAVERTERLRQLLRAGRAGDRSALGELLGLFRDYLLAIARMEIPTTLQAKFGASDIVQNTVLEAYRIFADFEGQQPEELSAWLRQVLLFKLSEEANRFCGIQKRAVSREVSLDDSHESASLRQSLVAPGPTPSSHAARHEEAAGLREALARLPEPYRQVITWRTWDGLSFADVGSRLGRSEEAARKLYGRAMTLLQEEMGGNRAAAPDRPDTDR